MERIFWRAVFLLVLIGTQAHAEEADERRVLLEQRDRLSKKIDLLKREQDLLLFRRTMYQSDSKYLLVDVKARTGSLFYRNRLLRSFPVVLRGRTALLPGAAAAVLTEKTEGKPRQRKLLFGKDMVIQARKKDAVTGINKPVLSIELGKGDLTSIYSALDVGSRAYILR